jgi:hypothetical protein
MSIRQCPARTISNWCNTLILDSSQDHTTAEDYSRLKTCTTDQSTVHPSYNHRMNVSITCLKLHLRSHTLNVLHLETTKWLVQEKIKTKQPTNQLLCPQSGLLIAKLTVPQLVMNFPTFHGTWRFITVHKRSCHLSLPPSHINPVRLKSSNYITWSSTPRME